MYGFYIHLELNPEVSFDKSLIFDDSIVYGNFLISYIKFDKFNNDKIFTQNKEFIIGIDGVILNLKHLKKQYAISDYFGLIVHLFKKEKIHFVSNLKGEFSGFIFEKETKTLYFFNNKTGTKQVFYSQFQHGLIIAPSIESIVKRREEHGYLNRLDKRATYNMLTFGGMIENQTLVTDIFKLGAGEYLTIKDEDLKLRKYFDFNEIGYKIYKKTQAITQINEVFIEALKLEYQKDEEYRYNHIATLSGGLDSRMNVMLAKNLGYSPKTFCFSQSNYADEKIAREIANNLDLAYEFIPLNGGNFLKTLEEMVSINNGLQFYHGSAHYNYALQQLDLSQYGLMHTGQIGDAILGGLVSGDKGQNYLSKTVSDRFINKIEIADSLFLKYRDEEVFKLYQRIFNLTNFGSYVVEQNQTYLVSPFLDADVIGVALSIHPELKYNQAIYIDWINKLHPEISNYKWERTGFKPNKKWKTAFSRYTNKIKKEYLIITKQQDKLSMNPLKFWFKNNMSISEFYDTYFDTQIDIVSTNQEVYSDLSVFYKNGSVTEKAIVLTLLEVIRKFKLKV